MQARGPRATILICMKRLLKVVQIRAIREMLSHSSFYDQSDFAYLSGEITSQNPLLLLTYEQLSLRSV
jgi:hypothetical protein